MPASAPWLDYAAPPQYAYFQQGPSGEAQALDPSSGGQDTGALAGFTGFLQRLGFTAASGGGAVNSNNSQVDTTLHWKISGTIILALIVIFGAQAMGFRFVSSASIGLGR